MRLLLVHPGASWSVSDVHDGLFRALGRGGHQVVSYALHNRIENAGAWLNYTWRRGKKRLPKPTSADTLYMAGVGILERALRFDVDWVLVISAIWLHPEGVHLLRRAGRKVAVYLTESPYDDAGEDLVAKAVDMVFTNERSAVPHFRDINPHSYYLAHSFDPEVHRPNIEPEIPTPAHDVVFVGTGFPERIEMLSGVNWDGIDFGLYGSWSLLGSRSRLRQYLRGEITPNLYTAALYQRGKIGINIHRTSIGFGRKTERVQHAESVNPRVVELAACGRFFVSDSRPELHEWFNGTVPTFSTAPELEAQIRRWLYDDKGRADIARALPGAVATQTFDARARQLVHLLETG